MGCLQITYRNETESPFLGVWKCGEGSKECKGVYDYGFRIYNPALGRFLSVDPLTKSYPMLTPYQFASNRPIDGIDLDGLEYLRADEARIKMVGGEAHINLDNFNTITSNAWKQRDATGRWPTGHIGYPTKVGELTHPVLPKSPDMLALDGTYGAPDPNYVTGQHRVVREIPLTKSGRPDRRFKQRAPVSGLSAGARGAAGAALVLNAVTWGLEQYGIYQNNEDRQLVSEHALILQEQVAADLTRALEVPGLIPEKYRNIQDLGSISNVILSGANPTDNQDIYDIGIEIVKKISKNYRQPMKLYHFDSGSETAPADNTSIGPILVPDTDKKNP